MKRILLFLLLCLVNSIHYSFSQSGIKTPDKYEQQYLYEGKKTYGIKDTIDQMQDSIVLYFSSLDIVKINESLPREILNKIDLSEEKYYYRSSLLQKLENHYGKSDANYYLSILETNCSAKSERQLIKEKERILYNALETGEKVYIHPDLNGIELRRINEIPGNIFEIYRYYELFQLRSTSNYLSNINRIGIIYKGEVIQAEKAFNIAYFETKDLNPINMEERLIAILQIATGFMSEIVLNRIEFVNVSNVLYTHTAYVSIDNIERIFEIDFKYDRFYFLSEITNLTNNRIRIFFIN